MKKVLFVLVAVIGLCSPLLSLAPKMMDLRSPVKPPIANLQSSNNSPPPLVNKPKTMSSDKNPDAYRNKGVTEFKAGHIQQAIQAFHTAFNLEPKNAQTCYNLGFLYEKTKQWNNAILYSGKAIALEPTMTNAYMVQAVAYFQKGNHVKAIQDFENASRLDPKNIDSLNDLGILYCLQHQKEKARSQYQQLVALNPAKAETLKKVIGKVCLL